MAELKGGVDALGGRVQSLEDKTKRLTQGVAASMAMPSLSLAPGKKFAFGVDMSTYDGTQAIGGSAAFALDKTWSVQGSIGGSVQGGPAGGRVGVRAQW